MVLDLLPRYERVLRTAHDVTSWLIMYVVSIFHTCKTELLKWAEIIAAEYFMYMISSEIYWMVLNLALLKDY